MLFSSFEYLFVFLPVSVIIFYILSVYDKKNITIIFLVLTSLFFYGWWNPAYLWLMITSIIVNYRLGLTISRAESHNKRLILIFGIITNLAFLAYFKYTGFFISIVNNTGLLESPYQISNILLPLAISFFTFQQVAFLVDSYRGEVLEYKFLNYCLFVTFFPQLIAGPIVHHKEMLPQFEKESTYKINFNNIAMGISLIIIGMFKKLVIADGVAIFVDPIFSAAENGQSILFLEAWGGALAYTIQIYFDFSGYVDMAIGSALLFGIVLPINFNSPYKATNIIDFWRAWHITLSRFLRDYLYIPLGGNRKGNFRRHVNLMLTMVIGGLWHGAGWTFIFWGFLHGTYLAINHVWRTLTKNIFFPIPTLIKNLFSWVLTFIAVVLAWVYFRAESFSGATIIVQAMFGQGFMSLPDTFFGRLGGFENTLVQFGFTFDSVIIIELKKWLSGFCLIIFAFFIATVLPNSSQIFSKTGDKKLIAWQASLAWVVMLFFMFMTSILYLFRVSPFLYFNF